MIRPELKGEPYLAYNDMSSLNDFTPEDSRDFSLVVELGIGERASEGFDNYTINVCTPSWLARELKKNGKPIFVKGVLLMEEYDPVLISSRIVEVITSTSGKDWDEVNMKLVKYFNWEFEDYKPNQ